MYHKKHLSYAEIALDPMDTYATSKLCGERCARSFARRFPGTDIYALRIGNVIEPHEYNDDFLDFVNKPETRKRNAWSVIDARDLGQICDLCISKDGLGFQVFNATNTTRQVLSEWHVPSSAAFCVAQGTFTASKILLLTLFVRRSTLKVPTEQYLKEACPNTPITRELGKYEAPLSNRKAREVLGFEEQHPWHRYLQSGP